jgi:hypothetical protein
MAQQIAVRVLELVDDESHRRVILAAPRAVTAPRAGLEPTTSAVSIRFDVPHGMATADDTRHEQGRWWHGKTTEDTKRRYS